MEDDAATVLGEPILEGVIALPPGFANKAKQDSRTGLVSLLVRKKQAKDAAASPPPTANEMLGASSCYLALTASSFAIFRVVDGAMKSRLGDLALRVPRPEVIRLDCSGKAAAGVRELVVDLGPGRHFPLELSAISVKKIERMKAALGI